MTWEYIAGFFDGEGTIAHNGKGFRIAITQTNESVLKGIQQLSGSGYILMLKKRKSHWKESWLFYIAKQEDVYKFILRIKDYLIVKKILAEQVAAELKIYLEIERRRKLLKKKRIQRAKILRANGWSYRKIGKALHTDWGYIRRLLLK